MLSSSFTFVKVSNNDLFCFNKGQRGWMPQLHWGYQKEVLLFLYQWGCWRKQSRLALCTWASGRDCDQCCHSQGLLALLYLHQPMFQQYFSENLVRWLICQCSLCIAHMHQTEQYQEGLSRFSLLFCLQRRGTPTCHYCQHHPCWDCNWLSWLALYKIRLVHKCKNN